MVFGTPKLTILKLTELPVNKLLGSLALISEIKNFQIDRVTFQAVVMKPFTHQRLHYNAEVSVTFTGHNV